eukprot:7195982-Ditylum_brightwellii.AAC.1
MSVANVKNGAGEAQLIFQRLACIPSGQYALENYWLKEALRLSFMQLTTRIARRVVLVLSTTDKHSPILFQTSPGEA